MEEKRVTYTQLQNEVLKAKELVEDKSLATPQHNEAVKKYQTALASMKIFRDNNPNIDMTPSWIQPS